MARQSKKSTDATSSNQAIPPFGFPAFNGALAESYAQAGRMLVENAVNMNQEIVRFAGERLQTDLATLQAMMRCANLNDAIAVQTEFVQSAVKAYQTELGKLWEQGAQTTAEASEALGNATERSSGGTHHE